TSTSYWPSKSAAALTLDWAAPTPTPPMCRSGELFPRWRGPWMRTTGRSSSDSSPLKHVRRVHLVSQLRTPQAHARSGEVGVVVLIEAKPDEVVAAQRQGPREHVTSRRPLADERAAGRCERAG